jgi:hypothetical protein
MYSSAGMNHHARRLIDSHQVIVFIQNRQRNLLRRRAQRRKLSRLHICDIPGPDQIGRPAGCAVDQDPGVLDPVLQARTAELRKAPVEHVIQSLAGIFRT